MNVVFSYLLLLALSFLLLFTVSGGQGEFHLDPKAVAASYQKQLAEHEKKKEGEAKTKSLFEKGKSGLYGLKKTLTGKDGKSLTNSAAKRGEKLSKLQDATENMKINSANHASLASQLRKKTEKEAKTGFSFF